MNHNEQQARGEAFRRICRYAPGLGSLLRYQSSWLGSDIAAGLSVAAIALPVGIAYSDLAGVPAVVGMYSAIFPLLAYALFGSSRQLMTGPDAATAIIVAASLGPLAGGDTQLYLALMVVLTLMTGTLYIIGGVMRLGFIANFLSQPILAGYLNGIALIILMGQLPKLCGYTSSATDVFSQWVEFAGKLPEAHLPTLMLGLGLLVAMVVLRRLSPRLPAALVVVVAGIVAVATLGLQQHGVAILGEVPAGLPGLHLAPFDPEKLRNLFVDAAGITLVSFTSGVLTAKSFARLNRYDIDANQELIAFGAANLATGIAQGFPVTGADSRTAVNNAMGGKTQMVGIVAAAAMLVVLFFLTNPLGYVPITALAAVIMVSAVGLFDFATLRDLYRSSRRELLLSVTTTLGVLLLGVLHGVLLAVVLSLLWLLAVGSRPHDAVLGRVPGIKGFHDITDYPGVTTVPGLVLYRFDANLVFFNTDYFRDRVRAIIAAAESPVEWFVVDASTINVVDITALQKFAELREELAARGIVLGTARVKRNLMRFFDPEWAHKQAEQNAAYRFTTLKSAVRAFNNRAAKATSPELAGTRTPAAADMKNDNPSSVP
ncbi:MAG: sulfate permease [Gammaproteobacteria bacterium]